MVRIVVVVGHIQQMSDTRMNAWIMIDWSAVDIDRLQPYHSRDFNGYIVLKPDVTFNARVQATNQGQGPYFKESLEILDASRKFLRK